MLTGMAYLDRDNKELVNEAAKNKGLKEVESIDCWQCRRTYRLFAGPEFSGSLTDINDLRERALQFIATDCPANVGEGQPIRGPHTPRFELLENGKTSV